MCVCETCVCLGSVGPEGGVGAPGTGVGDAVSQHVGAGKLNTGPAEE